MAVAQQREQGGSTSTWLVGSSRRAVREPLARKDRARQDQRERERADDAATSGFDR